MAKKNKSGKQNKLKVLFVCTGNTCRSPIAGAVLRELVRSSDLEHRISVETAGLMARDGLPASAPAAEVCAGKGLDLSAHRSRQLTAAILSGSDIVICMQHEHLYALERLEQVRGVELLLMGTFSSLAGKGSPPDISDPFGGGRGEYERACEMITDCMPGLMEYLKSRLKRKKSERKH